MRYYLILFFLLVSCGTRKVAINNSEINTDTTTKIDSTVKEENNINTTIVSDDIEIIAADTSKEVIINGISYKNVIFRHKKNKTNIVDHSKKITVKTVNLKKRVQIEIKKKNIDKKSFPYYWLILILIIPLYYLFKKYRDKIWFV